MPAYALDIATSKISDPQRRTQDAAAIAGKAKAPFSALQLSRLMPEELAKLRAYSAGRYQRLDADQQRRRLAANLYLLIVTVPDDVYMAAANMPPLGEQDR